MGGLEPGRYHLRLAADPSPLVGVNFYGPGTQPVITEGRENVWVVEDMGDGKYGLIVEGAGGPPMFIQEKDGSPVGAINPPPAVWIIEGPEGGPYIIRKDTPIFLPIAWTVRSPSVPHSPVSLDVLPLEHPPENQKWYFVPPSE